MEKLSWLVTMVLHPLSLLVIGGLIYFSLIKRKKKRTIRVFFISVVLVLFWILSTPFVLRPLIAMLEDEFRVFVPSHFTTSKAPSIIVLGSGTGHDSRLPSTSLLSSTSLLRLVEGIRIARKIPDAQLITSARSKEGYRPQAYVARDAAIELGIDSNRIVALPTAGNTREEAEAFVKFAGKGAKVIVCTSAIHMPRAMEWFRRAGADPIAAPCDFIIKKDDPPLGLKAFFPQPELWQTWQFVLKEYLGLLYFKLKQV
jgi:uncharacterized SAM-binding protein YcdF (DUF218 family)